jgi:hypothetical protein
MKAVDFKRTKRRDLKHPPRTSGVRVRPTVCLSQTFGCLALNLNWTEILNGLDINLLFLCFLGLAA